MNVQIGLFNHRVWPQSFDQALPVHDLSRIPHQQQEQIEFLGRQHYDLAISIETMLSGGEPERAEFVKLIVLPL